MKIELTKKQFRRLLDMVYIGNWVLNSTRGEDRFKDYDDVESLLFSFCEEAGMAALYENTGGVAAPSKAFVEGGIHDAIMDYEDAVFYEILAEELARRDMSREALPQDDYDELMDRMNDYIAEFEQNGTENLCIDV
ncbi:MAG: hypothetical protein GXX89_10100 [Clostridiales bacterium]|jgi:hypothetical protein|nr:hypothetical protein [Clostridiales bacterium]